MSASDIVKKQLVYWLQVKADGTITNQNGPALLTVGLVDSVYTITMPGNNTVPILRRSLVITADSIVLLVGNVATYDSAASTDSTVVVRGFEKTSNEGQNFVVANCGFICEIWRVEALIGDSAG